MRLVNSDEGHKHLVIFGDSDHGDILEEHVMRIFTKVEPKLRSIWPDVIDDQEEALCTGIVHWVEREAKLMEEPDPANDCGPIIGIISPPFR
jgi:hypothetical protein